MRQPTGSVGIESKGNRLRLRLPSQIAKGSNRYLSLKLPDNSEGRRKALQIKLAIEEDIARGQFDPTLSRYRPDQPSQRLDRVTLLDLWDSFTAYKAPELSQTTLKSYRGKYRNHIAQIRPGDSRLEILTRMADRPVAASRLLGYLKAAIDWGKCNGLAVDLGDMTPTRPNRKLTIDPFSPEELAAILEAFRDLKPRYYPFVSFLANTGCRPSEAIALTWQDVRAGHIRIDKAYSEFGVKPTKTGECRNFRTNPAIERILELCDRSSPLLFPAAKGGYLNLDRFTKHVWAGKGNYRGILPDLLKSGKVARYRPTYNLRHTAITLWLSKGVPVQDVASWVGNSPEVIFKHYAGVTDREVPTIL